MISKIGKLMSAPNPAEEITKLEAELKQMQDNYLQAEQVMKNCRDRIIGIQAAIDTNKKYLPEEAVKTEPAGFTNN